MSGPSDHRRTPRLKVTLPIEVSASSDGSTALSFLLKTRDLSSGGAYLPSDLFFEVGERLTLQLGLPEGGRLPMAGKVAWIKQDQEPDHMLCGMGIEFVELSERERRTLAELTRTTHG